MWYSQTERKTVRHKSRLSDTIMDPLVPRYPGGFPIKPRDSLFSQAWSYMVMQGLPLLQYGPPCSNMGHLGHVWTYQILSGPVLSHKKEQKP